jgi:hypothetical protein
LAFSIPASSLLGMWARLASLCLMEVILAIGYSAFTFSIN